MDAVASPLGVSFEFLRDFLLAAGRADEDAILLQALLVVCKVVDGDAARTEEAMAASGATGGNAGHRQFQRLAIEHSDNPANRTNEARPIEARPGHGTWPGQIVHGTRRNRGQDL